MTPAQQAANRAWPAVLPVPHTDREKLAASMLASAIHSRSEDERRRLVGRAYALLGGVGAEEAPNPLETQKIGVSVGVVVPDGWATLGNVR